MWHRPAFQVTPAWLDSDPRGFFAAYPKGRSDVRLSSGPSVSSQARRGSYHPTNEEHWAVLSLQASCSPLLIGLVTPVGPCPPVPPGRPESSLLLSSAPEEPEEPLKSGQVSTCVALAIPLAGPACASVLATQWRSMITVTVVSAWRVMASQVWLPYRQSKAVPQLPGYPGPLQETG